MQTRRHVMWSLWAVVVLWVGAAAARATDDVTFQVTFDGPVLQAEQAAGVKEIKGKGAFVEGAKGQAFSLTEGTLTFNPEKNLSVARGSMELRVLDLDFNAKFAGQQRNIVNVRGEGYYLQLMTINHYLSWRLYIFPAKFPVAGQGEAQLYRQVQSGHLRFFPAGQWTHIAVAWDVETRTLRMAVNGEDVRAVTYELVEGVNPMRVLSDYPWREAQIGFHDDSLMVIDDLTIRSSIPEGLFISRDEARDDATQHDSRVGRDWKPALEVVSPHIPWLKPNAAGVIKLLVVQPWENLRESVEMAERLEVELDVIPVTSVGPRCNETKGMFRYEKEDFLAKIAKADVVMLGGIPAQWFDEEAWAALLKAVEEGKGIVWSLAAVEHARLVELAKTKVATPDYLKRGVPYQNLSMWNNPDRGFTFIERGKGRMALLDCGNQLFTRYSSLAPIYYTHDGEFYYALLARLAVWTARREPAVRVEVMGVPGAEAGQAVDWAKAKVEIEGPKDWTQAAHVEVVVRDVYAGWAYDEKGNPRRLGVRGVGESTYPELYRKTVAVKLQDGKQVVPFDFPALPYGRYSVDAQLFVEHLGETKAKAVDWDSELMIVNAAPLLFGVTPKVRAYAEGAQASIEHRFKRMENAPDATLNWQVSDVFGRVLLRGNEAWNRTDTQVVSFQVPAVLTKGLYYEVEVKRGEVLLQRDKTAFLIPKRGIKPFYYAVYSVLEQRFETLKADVVVNGIETDRQMVDLNVEAFYWFDVPGVKLNLEPGVTVRAPSFTDPAWRKEVDEYLAKRGASLGYQKGLGGVLVDEWEYADYRAAPYHDLDHHPTSVAAFREFLRDRMYGGSLSKLNEVWGTQYASWDDVEMKLNKDVDLKVNPAPTMDRMSFVDTVVAEAMGYVNEAAARHDPELRLGLSGTRPANGNNGYDYWKLMNGKAHAIVNYGGPMPAESRSFARSGDFVATWEGYGSNFRATAGESMWRAFIIGHDAFINYGAYPHFGPHVVDWTLGAGAIGYAAAYRELDAGMAALVRGGKRQRDPVAIHYSQASLHMLPMGVAGVDSKRFDDNLNSLIQLLEDSGIEARFVSTEQILGGTLATEGVKVLYLPLSVAMGDAEAEAIRKFVVGGGTLMADAVCGLRDEHGKARPEYAGVLDEFMGVRRGGEAKYVGQVGKVVQGEKTASAMAGEMGIAVAAGVEAGGELTLGEQKAPVLLTRKQGAGQTVFLNFTFADYNVVQAAGVGGEVALITRAKNERRAEAQGQFGALLARAQVRPAVRVEMEAGKDGRRLETLTACYADGAALYALVQANHAGAMRLEERAVNKATIHLPRRAHVYDVRAGKYLGQVERVQTMLTEGDARVYALLPYEVKGATVVVKEKQARVGQVVNYEVGVRSVVETGRQVAHVTVKGPDGRERAAYAANVERRGVIPLALNDAPGKWRVLVRDVASGMTAEAGFEVVE